MTNWDFASGQKNPVCSASDAHGLWLEGYRRINRQEKRGMNGRMEEGKAESFPKGRTLVFI